MKCCNCGSEIDHIVTSVFTREGNDIDCNIDIYEIDDNVQFETTDNWTAYGLTEEEQRECIECPVCRKFPFKCEEVQVYDVVRVVCFKK